MSNIEVKVLADSTANGVRLTTLQLRYPRFIHAELMTHRALSKNASSSRAIPVKKMLAQVWNDPAMPVYWGSNKPGMQAGEELTGIKRWAAEKLWRGAGKVACSFAWGLMKLGLHKQLANRILEPWQYIHVVVSGTEWSNFFGLRCHPDAQPEIQALARGIRTAMDNSNPKRLMPGEWHLPYIHDWDVAMAQVYLSEYQVASTDFRVQEVLRKVSAARCCRVSYMNHWGGTYSSIEEDMNLCEKLMKSRPIHASPFEHQASPDIKLGNLWNRPEMHGNFQGWIQHRKQIEKDLK
jgi:hypothetical protein